MARDWTAPKIMEFSGVYWATCTLHAAIRLDVFTVLEDMGDTATVTDLASRLGCDLRALDMLVTALSGLEFLERDGDRIKGVESAMRYLSRHSKQYVGFLIRHHADLVKAWADLATAVKTGHSVRTASASHTEDESERQAFLMGMFNIAVHQADVVAGVLDLSGRTKLMDLGGGPGTYAVHFCKQYEGLHATVFDMPTTKPFAQLMIERYDLSDRIDFVGGNFLENDLPGGFDVVWISQVLHGESPENSQKIIKKAAGSLNRGGLLCVQEFVIDEARQGHPLFPALFSLNMLLQTEGGQGYTGSEISAMMTRVGVRNIYRVPVDLPQGCGIIVGEAS